MEVREWKKRGKGVKQSQLQIRLDGSNFFMAQCWQPHAALRDAAKHFNVASPPVSSTESGGNVVTSYCFTGVAGVARASHRSRIHKGGGGGVALWVRYLRLQLFAVLGVFLVLIFLKKTANLTSGTFSSEIGAFCGTLPTFNLSSNFFCISSRKPLWNPICIICSLPQHSPVHAPMVGVIITKHNSLLFICPRGALPGICFLRQEVALRWRCGNDRGKRQEIFSWLSDILAWLLQNKLKKIWIPSAGAGLGLAASQLWLLCHHFLHVGRTGSMWKCTFILNSLWESPGKRLVSKTSASGLSNGQWVAHLVCSKPALQLM